MQRCLSKLTGLFEISELDHGEGFSKEGETV